MSSKVLLVLGGLALAAAGFAAGYFVGNRGDSAAEMQDYALDNLLSYLDYIHFTEQTKPEELRSISDIKAEKDLNTLRKHLGAISNPEFLGAQTRTLAKIGDLWGKSPPFQSPDFQQAKEQFWFPEWQRDYEANLVLLKSAQTECARTDCNAHNNSLKRTAADGLR